MHFVCLDFFLHGKQLDKKLKIEKNIEKESNMNAPVYN